MMLSRVAAVALLAALAFGTGACAELGGLRALVQPPVFEQDEAQPAEIRLVSPSLNRPLGGASVRIWTKVTNPNAFGFTLGTLEGTLFLESSRAAEASFPLGLPLGAGQETVIPLDLSISFSDLPDLAGVIRRAASGDPVAYRLDGTVGVDAGRMGQPVFGPMTLLRGNVRKSRELDAAAGRRGANERSEGATRAARGTGSPRASVKGVWGQRAQAMMR